jgi:hypothetical protein
MLTRLHALVRRSRGLMIAPFATLAWSLFSYSLGKTGLPQTTPTQRGDQSRERRRTHDPVRELVYAGSNAASGSFHAS